MVISYQLFQASKIQNRKKVRKKRMEIKNGAFHKAPFFSFQ
ncbi:hypothetical protein HMPREF1981_01562 [Bacteroides pyogenes F0041]|uniref:Uncharacterized protein n=1 Tax=Bacteroides pyogenes F0041 TaxID=1321819 RepID=U2E039_9BACE|nr:hypothetical protein HMPREF1981_01562 [Bacteroides pyogenes F0041]